MMHKSKRLTVTSLTVFCIAKEARSIWRAKNLKKRILERSRITYTVIHKQHKQIYDKKKTFQDLENTYYLDIVLFICAKMLNSAVFWTYYSDEGLTSETSVLSSRPHGVPIYFYIYNCFLRNTDAAHASLH